MRRRARERELREGDVSPLRQAVLRRVLDEGAVYAGSGYGALFEELMLAQADEQLALVDRAGVSYLVLTEKGRAAIEVSS